MMQIQATEAVRSMSERDKLSGMRQLLKELRSASRSLRNGKDITKRQVEALEQTIAYYAPDRWRAQEKH
jgi:hypothetical protein